MLKTAFALTMGLLLAGPALAGGTQPVTFAERNGQVDFSTPSNNIECLYTPHGGTPHYTAPGGSAEISCDRQAPTYVRTSLLEAGVPSVLKDVSDQSCCGVDNILQYGQSITLGPFTCESQMTGLVCRRGSNGFQISKAAIKAW